MAIFKKRYKTLEEMEKAQEKEELEKFKKGITTYIKRPKFSKRFVKKTKRVGRGRPRGSYKYFIPGRGAVSVSEWRKFLAKQKQLLKMRLQQQKALQQFPPQYQQYSQYQYPQQQVRTVSKSSPTYIETPQYPQRPADLKIWEDMPGIGLNPNIQQPPQMFYEKDLATGQLKLRKSGSFI